MIVSKKRASELNSLGETAETAPLNRFPHGVSVYKRLRHVQVGISQNII